AVLISPDGALARLPWTALPGTRPGSYLIEDLSIAIVPVPLLRTGGEKRSRSPAALLVGVGASGVGTVPTEKPRAPVQPPSVSQEIVAVGDEFARTHAGHTSSSLTGAEATRAALQKQAPGKTHLHLAVPSFQTA